MASNTIDSPITSDEDCCSGDDERESSGRRRRRFCIERKQQLIPPSSKSQRTKSDSERCHRSDYDRITTTRRRKVRVENMPKIIPRSSAPPPQLTHKPKRQREQAKGPVIFINPKFVKKFIEKSIELASSSSKSTTTKNTTNDISNTSTRTPLQSMLADIDFKTSSRESLKAASTMAIIRLVTECIEDDHKRDEKLNKTLVGRLIDGLIQHGDEEDTELIVKQELKTPGSTSCQSRSQNSDISEDERESSSEGRPIPVIGGSVNHFNNNNNSIPFYASSSNYRHSSYQRPRRVASEESIASSDVHRDKLRNFS